MRARCLFLRAMLHQEMVTQADRTIERAIRSDAEATDLFDAVATKVAALQQLAHIDGGKALQLLTACERQISDALLHGVHKAQADVTQLRSILDRAQRMHAALAQWPGVAAAEQQHIVERAEAAELRAKRHMHPDHRLALAEHDLYEQFKSAPQRVEAALLDELFAALGARQQGQPLADALASHESICKWLFECVSESAAAVAAAGRVPVHSMVHSLGATKTIRPPKS